MEEEEEIRAKLLALWAEGKDISENELPEGWRWLDYRIFKKLALIEAKLEHFHKQEDNIVLIIQGHEALLKLQKQDIDELYQGREKFNELYYHVFPERLAQDLEVLKQLDALKSKRDPDADTKKA